MKRKNYDKIASIEKAISKKYGKEAIQNPNSSWDDDKEQEYLESSKKFQKKISKSNEDNDLVEVDGFLMPRKLINHESKRICPVCSIYSFNKADDYYMNKYDCCSDCFIKWVDDREERWLKGWRPKKEK